MDDACTALRPGPSHPCLHVEAPDASVPAPIAALPFADPRQELPEG